MSYLSKLKDLLGQKQEESEEKLSDIEFTPDELREMNDPTTAVGRLLNPQRPLTKVEKDPLFNWGRIYPGAYELLKKGRDSTERSIQPEKAYEEAVAATADAYLKDAEKRGVVSSSDDRITKNYKIINDLIQEKNLKNVKFKNEADLRNYGHFNEKTNTINIDPYKNNPFEYLDDTKIHHSDDPLVDGIKRMFKQETDSKNYPKLPISKQKEIQNNQLDKHLNTTIHELRHAEDFKKDPEGNDDYHGHFSNTPEYEWDENLSGKVQDIQAAALQRLSNMGRKKKSK